MAEFGGGIEQAKLWFFDQKKILDKTKAAEARVQARFGAFVRTKARSSMRKRKRSAAPGSPPSVHRGDLKRLLFFGRDPATESVVVGPVPFAAGKAPRLLEHGGTTTKTVPIPRATGAPASERQKETFLRLVHDGRITLPARSRKVVATYPGHPFMRPALEAEAPKFAGLFRGEVR